MQATAKAHSNIALIKYWGKQSSEANLPAAGSISATLSPLTTTTTVRWTDTGSDRVELNEEAATGKDLQRIVAFLDIIRGRHGLDKYATIHTNNNFPTAAGLASSASGFAALALASTHAASLDYDLTRLSELARRGSGSAARSLHGGFVQMAAGTPENPSSASASQICRASDWGELQVVLALTTSGRKKISSTLGMNRTQQNSPYFDAWVQSVNRALPLARQAIEDRDFSVLAELSEASALQMHASAIAANPGVLYWNGTTVELIHLVRQLREERGLQVFFTIDAGPHVKIFTTAEDIDEVESAVRNLDNVVDTMRASIGGQATIVD